MKKLNFLQRKARGNYLLEVVDAPVAKSVKKSRLKGGFSYAKKIAAGATLVTLAFIGVGGGVVAATAADNQATSANAFNLFDPMSMLCQTKDSPGAYLSGKSTTLLSGWEKEKKTSPVGNGINITLPGAGLIDDKGKATAQWTALEQYGYYSPSYESWQGIAYSAEEYDDGKWPFVGSGGSGKANNYGSIVAITDAETSPLLAQSLEDCMNFGAAANVGIGNFISFGPKLAIALAGETYGIASNMDITNETSPLHGLANGVSDMITGGDDPSKGLRQVLFLDWLVAIIFIATISLIWVGIVKRSSMQAGQGAIWMIGATVAGFLFLSNPMWVPGMVDNVVGKINASVTTAILPPESNNTSLCAIGSGSEGQDAAVRQVKCSLWYSTVYTPWVDGQFGVDQYSIAKIGNAEDLKGAAKAKVNNSIWMTSDSYKTVREGSEGSNIAVWGDTDLKGTGFEDANEEANSVKETTINEGKSRGILANDKAKISFGTEEYAGKMDWAIYMLDRQNNSTQNRGVDYSEIAFNQLVINNNTHWGNASDAVGSSMMSILAAVGPVVILMSLSVTMIAYQISMIFLVAFSPLLFLAGVAPGWGRRIAMRWFELIVGLLIKRIVLAIFLVLFVRLYTLVLATTLDWWIQVLVVAVLSFVALAQKDKISDIFNTAINFGGDKRIDGGGAIGKEMKQKAYQGTRSVTRGGTFLAARYGAPVAAKAGAAVSAKAAIGRKKVAASAKNGVSSLNEKVTAPDKRAKVGVLTEPEKTKHWDKTTDRTLNKGRLNAAELEHIKGDDGKFDRARAKKFIESKKTQFTTADAANKTAQQKAIEKQKHAKDMMKHKDTRKQGREVMKEAKEEREAVRARAKALQKDTVRIFGKDESATVKGKAKALTPKLKESTKPTYYKKKDRLFEADHKGPRKKK